MNVDLVKKWLATDGVIDNLAKGETAGLARILDKFAAAWGDKTETYLVSAKEKIESEISSKLSELEKVNAALSGSLGGK